MEEQPTPTPATPNAVKINPVVDFIAKEWRVIKTISFWISVGLAVIGISLIEDWHYRGVLAQLNQELNTKQGTIDDKQSRVEFVSQKLDQANHENDQLRSQNALLQSIHDEKTFPLKKRVQILVKQINDFADNLAQHPQDMASVQQKFNEWDKEVIVVRKACSRLLPHCDKRDSSRLRNFIVRMSNAK